MYREKYDENTGQLIVYDRHGQVVEVIQVKRRNPFVFILMVAAVVMFVMLVISIGVMNLIDEPVVQTISPPTIQVINANEVYSGISNISELATVQFNYGIEFPFTDWTKLGFLPVGWTNYTYKADYEVKAGIDLRYSAVQVSGNQITVALPPAQILSVVKVSGGYDKVDQVLFADVKPEILNAIEEEGKRRAMVRACEADIINAAGQQAVVELSRWLSTAYSGATISIQPTQGICQ